MGEKPDAVAFHLKWQHAAYSKNVNTLSCQTEIQESQRQTRKFPKEILFLIIILIFYSPSIYQSFIYLYLAMFSLPTNGNEI